jgi:hypothetical protein
MLPPEEARRFEDELREELSKGHALRGKAVRAVARRQDCDDVLFKVDGEEFCRRPSRLSFRLDTFDVAKSAINIIMMLSKRD